MNGNGTIYIIEFIFGADKTLRTKTMRKEQSLGGGGSVENNNSSHTSKTGTNATVPSTANSISRSKQVGQQLINLIQNAGIEVITDKAEMKRVLGEGLDKAVEDEIQNAQFLKTSRGEVYGFAMDGKVYIAPDLLNANTLNQMRDCS